MFELAVSCDEETHDCSANRFLRSIVLRKKLRNDSEMAQGKRRKSGRKKRGRKACVGDGVECNGDEVKGKEKKGKKERGTDGRE